MNIQTRGERNYSGWVRSSEEREQPHLLGRGIQPTGVKLDSF
jgi:hypothetical protein